MSTLVDMGPRGIRNMTENCSGSISAGKSPRADDDTAQRVLEAIAAGDGADLELSDSDYETEDPSFDGAQLLLDPPSNDSDVEE